MPETCAECQGRDFLGFDLPRDHPRFGQIVPCPICYPNYYEHPGASPLREDLGECEVHHMKWRRFWNGGIGHTLTAVDRHEIGASPLWCIKGHKMTQAEFERWLEAHGAEILLGDEHRERGETWCPLHRQWERQNDLIDYPVSADFLRYYAYRGLTPWQDWMQEKLAPPKALIPEPTKDIKEVKPRKRLASPKRPPTVLDAFRE